MAMAAISRMLLPQIQFQTFSPFLNFNSRPHSRKRNLLAPRSNAIDTNVYPFSTVIDPKSFSVKTSKFDSPPTNICTIRGFFSWKKNTMMNASMATMEDNVAKKDKLHQVAAMKAKSLSFKKRKACIKKKTMELSVLCDVEACAVIIDGNGEVETWPENQSVVLRMISRYNSSLRAGDDKMVVKNEHAYDKNLLNDHGWEWDDSLFNGLSTESLEDLLKDCACDGDQNQDKDLNLQSWDDLFIDGLPIESLQEVLKVVDAKLEAVAKRVEVLKTADDQNNNNGKEIVVFNDAPEQNIQTPNSFSVAMCLFEGGSSQHISQSSNFGWFDDGSGSLFNNILGPSGLDVPENNNQRAQSFGGAPEQGFLNMMYGEQTIQTPWVSAEELEYQNLFNMVPGMYPSDQFSLRGLSFFEESEFPEQNNLGVGQNWKANYNSNKS